MHLLQSQLTNTPRKKKKTTTSKQIMNLHGLAKVLNESFEFKKVGVHDKVLEVDFIPGGNIVPLHVFDDILKHVCVAVDVQYAGVVFFPVWVHEH